MGKRIKRLEFKEAFSLLPEEEIFLKYFELLHKTLSGSLGKESLKSGLFPLQASNRKEAPRRSMPFATVN